jgi:hypothetical protein
MLYQDFFNILVGLFFFLLTVAVIGYVVAAILL